MRFRAENRIKADDDGELDEDEKKPGKRVYLVFPEQFHGLPTERLFVVLVLFAEGFQFRVDAAHRDLRLDGRKREREQDKTHEERDKDDGDADVAARHKTNEERERVIDRLVDGRSKKARHIQRILADTQTRRNTSGVPP